MVLSDLIVNLTKKNKQNIGTANHNFFQNETHLIWIVQ